MADVLAISREELAWAAGFFDGEGHVAHVLKKNGAESNRRGYLRSDIQIDIPQVSPVVLDRFHSAVLQAGRVKGPYGPYDDRPGTRPHWYYRASGFEDVQAVIAMLWTFLSPVKKEQAHAALTAYHAAPIKRLKRMRRKEGGSNS